MKAITKTKSCISVKSAAVPGSFSKPEKTAVQ